ncbi:MAG: RNA pseudouridine synthase, partial [Hydrogenoanaerobacterium sp.]
IRVHMSYIGHPVAGDDVYGPKKPIKSLNGQCLHARTLGFIHPISGEYLEFTSDLPAYFTDFLNTLKED